MIFKKIFNVFNAIIVMFLFITIYNMDPRKSAKQFQAPTGFLGRLFEIYHSRKNQPMVEWVISLLKLQPDDHVLEVGFGPGKAIKKLSQIVKDGKIAGVDVSEVMFKAACKRNKAAIKKGQIDLQNNDLHNVTYAENSFDKVLSIEVIYFFSDPVESLKYMWRIIKPNGYAAIYIAPKHELSQLKFANTGVFNLYTEQELNTMMEQAGFVNLRSYTKQISKYETGICILGQKSEKAG